MVDLGDWICEKSYQVWQESHLVLSLLRVVAWQSSDYSGTACIDHITRDLSPTPWLLSLEFGSIGAYLLRLWFATSFTSG